MVAGVVKWRWRGVEGLALIEKCGWAEGWATVFAKLRNHCREEHTTLLAPYVPHTSTNGLTSAKSLDMAIITGMMYLKTW